ncbi:MAG: SIS domain-containing protein [Gemmatimonadales bacterium]
MLAAADRLDDGFATAVDLLAAADRVLVSGVGKSGAIGQKIAATLTSTGTPASWLHPVDSLHGDLGLRRSPAMAAILLTAKSGETEELFGLIAALARREVPIIAITGARFHRGPGRRRGPRRSVREEASARLLAPTTSTTVALALGDALAVALLERIPARGLRRTPPGRPARASTPARGGGDGAAGRRARP